MSIYDQRNTNAYGLAKSNKKSSKNKHILKWWNPDLDNLLAQQITKWQWVWYWGITEEIIKITDPFLIEEWKSQDPLCSKYAWYNVLMNFSISRSEQMGFIQLIRQPQKKVCLLCKNYFVEDSLPMPLIERLGIDRLNYCAPCLKTTVLQGSGNNFLTEGEIIEYLKKLTSIIGRVPVQNFGEGKQDLFDISDEQRLELLTLLKDKPTIQCVKSVFGSWLNALIKAEILEDGTRKTARGIQCIAKDGHKCLSLGEKTIDDYLYSHGIPHEKEPKYPESNYRGDFKVGEIFIEYFGLAGNPEYDAKIKEKVRLCQKHNIILIAIYPKDLVTEQKLQQKLSILV